MPQTFTDPREWVDRYGDILFRFALLRVQNPSVAEELVQETFLAALHSRGTFHGQSEERTWLVGILKHKISDYFRKVEQEHPIDTFLEDSPEGIDSLFDEKGMRRIPPQEWTEPPDKVVEKQEFWHVFMNCLAALPLRERHAFASRELDKMKGDEICKILNVTATNLWVLLHRARSRLRRCLEIHWFGTREKGREENA